ncbi:MAG: SDR family NAD(P)-dependent oxidoreductase, partial [Planctomycetota bacterium]
MESNLFNLSGKTALVTGGGRGIGFAIAKGLAGHGADVAIAARSKQQLETAARQIQHETGRKIWPFPFDLSNIENIDDFYKSIITETK